MFIIVDLPEPDGPMTATKSPAATSKSTPRSAWKLASPVPNVLVTPRSSMTGAARLTGTADGSSTTGALRGELARDHQGAFAQRIAR